MGDDTPVGGHAFQAAGLIASLARDRAFRDRVRPPRPAPKPRFHGENKDTDARKADQFPRAAIAGAAGAGPSSYPGISHAPKSSGAGASAT